jgi:predicted metal-dependent hydrolase
MPELFGQLSFPFFGANKPSPESASRSIALGDRIVPYTLRRAKRRTIGLSIDHRGLTVGAPSRATLRDIEALILKHQAWVVAKLDDWRNRRQVEPLQVVDGLRLPYLGGELEVRLLPLVGGRSRSIWADGTLSLCLKPGADARLALEKALRARALEDFAARLEAFTARLGVATPPLALSAARTRWGSCSSKSGIRLNWRLLHFPASVIDYVVAHEVAHLRQMNHSPRFWAVVESLYPDYRAAREELKLRAALCPAW